MRKLEVIEIYVMLFVSCWGAALLLMVTGMFTKIRMTEAVWVVGAITVILMLVTLGSIILIITESAVLKFKLHEAEVQLAALKRAIDED